MENLKAAWLLVRWAIVAYAVVLAVGMQSANLPDWAMAPYKLLIGLVISILSLFLPEAISSAIAIFGAITLPVLIIVYATSDEEKRD